MNLFKDYIRLARTSLKRNRGRSVITSLGIAIGVGSIVLILSLMGGIESLMKAQIEKIGEELIVVRPGSTSEDVDDFVRELSGANTYARSNLTVEDVKMIKELGDVTAVAPIAVINDAVTTDKNTVSGVTILGTSDDFNEIENLTMRYGEFNLTDGTVKTAVVGHTAALKLFNNNNPVGRTLLIEGEKFVVSGVLSEIDETVGLDNVDFDEAVIVEISDLTEKVSGVQVQQINVKAKNVAAVKETAAEIRNALTATKDGDEEFSVASGDEIAHPASTFSRTVTGVLAAVAGISLVVGGIGMMNIMLVSVSERTHEIGIRKAVGASGLDVMMQFLIEAVMLAMLGGILGLALGYIAAFFVSVATPFMPFISWQILLAVFLTSILIGIIFGLYPAARAARKDSISALKHYR